MFTVLFIVSWLAFSVGMSFVLGGYWIILWAVLGLLVAYLMLVLGMIFHVFVWFKLPLMNRFKNYGWRSMAYTLAHFVFNLRIKVIGKEKIPLKENLVVYSNHKSYLDPVIAIQVVKRPMAFTPKASLFKIPILRRGMIAMGCMPVYRDDNRKTAKALVETIKNIENGFAMVVFPEGGRKHRDTDSVVETRAGAFKLAVKPKATILPISINGNSQIQHNAPFRSTKITVVIHDPIPYEVYKDLSTVEIGDMVAGIINSGMINENEKE